MTPLDHRGDRLYITHCPGGVSGCILEPCIGRLCEFESPPLRTRIIFHLVHELTCGKRESVGEQHWMKNDDQWVLNRMLQNNEGDNRGGGGKDDTCDTACMSRSLILKLEVCQKKTTRGDDQSAISSNKEHVKYEAAQTYLSVTYQHTIACTCPANGHSNGVRDHSNNKACHPTVYSPPPSCGAA